MPKCVWVYRLDKQKYRSNNAKTLRQTRKIRKANVPARHGSHLAVHEQLDDEQRQGVCVDVAVFQEGDVPHNCSEVVHGNQRRLNSKEQTSAFKPAEEWCFDPHLKRWPIIESL